MARPAKAPSPVRPIGFVEFLTGVLGIVLSPAQRVLWLVIADGRQPSSFAGEDGEIARKLFGDVDEIPPDLLAVVAIVKGARIGGSYFASLRLLHLALTVPLRLAPGEVAFAIIVAPDLRLAKQAHRYVTGVLDAVPGLRGRETARTESTVTLRRDDGAEVVVETLPASRGGSSLRGRTTVGALLDEAAFFRDETYAVNDSEIYRAVSARVVPGGQVIVSSTPWAETGLLYDLFTKNHGSPISCVAVHAPTELMRTDAPSILRMVARERERDPENAAREYDAAFMTRGAGLFFDAVAIEQAIDDTLLVPRSGSSGAHVRIGVDPGFSRDASALVAIERDHDGRAAVLCVDELRPGKGSPLAPSFVVAHWALLAKSYGVRSVLSDVHYRESLREHFAREGLSLEPVPEGQIGKRAMYESARALLNEGKLRLPRHARLLQQMREVIARPTPGGGLSISSPRRAGAHGDLVSALVAATHALAPRGGYALREAMARLSREGV